MAYMHDWNCDVAEFSEELLEDVKIVLVHHADITRYCRFKYIHHI